MACLRFVYSSSYALEAAPVSRFAFRKINFFVVLQVIEDELRERIERLETRQATDDASLLILNRYWNQVNTQ